MRRNALCGIVLTVALVTGLLATAASAGHDFEFTGTVKPLEPFEWQGTVTSGANTDYNGQQGTPCDDAGLNYCDVGLVRVKVSADYWDNHAGGVQFSIGNYDIPEADYDLYVYKSNEDGRIGRLVGSSAGFVGVEESTCEQSSLLHR